MRLSTDEDRDEERSLATIAAAVEAGVTAFDTARSYARDEHELGHNERLVARALREAGAAATARVVTKGGMARIGGAWVPDGRAKTIRADCEASVVALGGLPIDLYLLHAPDPRTPWATSLRALARLVDEGLVRRAGVANVNRPLLDEALELAPVEAVQVPLSAIDDTAIRGGVVERCTEAGVTVIAHSPLGGPRRVRSLLRHETLATVAERRQATTAEIALAWILELSPGLVAIPGARRPETARSAASAAAIRLEPSDRELLASAFSMTRPRRPVQRHAGGEVVVVMGAPGAGKTRLAADFAARGYVRLNRDERGGSLRELAVALDETIASGAGRVVLDSTYLTRASRSFVVEIAERHGLHARCVWVDTPLAQAQVNLVERLLERFGSLPSPDELRELAKREQGVLTPTSQMRAFRELEPPTADEGFTAVEHVTFAREQAAGGAGVVVAAAALREGDVATDSTAPHLIFDWIPAGNAGALAGLAAELAAKVSAPVETAVCPHQGGPPVCWCRPPLPGLPLAFAREHDVDLSRSIIVGTGPAHRTLATVLGARYIQATS